MPVPNSFCALNAEVGVSLRTHSESQNAEFAASKPIEGTVRSSSSHQGAFTHPTPRIRVPEYTMTYVRPHAPAIPAGIQLGDALPAAPRPPPVSVASPPRHRLAGPRPYSVPSPEKEQSGLGATSSGAAARSAAVTRPVSVPRNLGRDYGLRQSGSRGSRFTLRPLQTDDGGLGELDGPRADVTVTVTHNADIFLAHGPSMQPWNSAGRSARKASQTPRQHPSDLLSSTTSRTPEPHLKPAMRRSASSAAGWTSGAGTSSSHSSRRYGSRAPQYHSPYNAPPFAMTPVDSRMGSASDSFHSPECSPPHSPYNTAAAAAAAVSVASSASMSASPTGLAATPASPTDGDISARRPGAPLSAASDARAVHLQRVDHILSSIRRPAASELHASSTDGRVAQVASSHARAAATKTSVRKPSSSSSSTSPPLHAYGEVTRKKRAAAAALPRLSRSPAASSRSPAAAARASKGRSSHKSAGATTPESAAPGTGPGGSASIGSLVGQLSAGGWSGARIHLEKGNLVEESEFKRLRLLDVYESARKRADEAWGDGLFEDCARALSDCIEVCPSAALYRFRSRAVSRLASVEGDGRGLAAAVADAGRAVEAELRSSASHLAHAQMLHRAKMLPESGVAFGEAMHLGASGSSDALGYTGLLETIRRERSYANLRRPVQRKAASTDLARSPWRANIFDPSRPPNEGGDVARPPAPKLSLATSTEGSLSVSWSMPPGCLLTFQDVGSYIAISGKRCIPFLRTHSIPCLMRCSHYSAIRLLNAGGAVSVDGIERQVKWSSRQLSELTDLEGKISSVVPKVFGKVEVEPSKETGAEDELVLFENPECAIPVPVDLFNVQIAMQEVVFDATAAEVGAASGANGDANGDPSNCSATVSDTATNDGAGANAAGGGDSNGYLERYGGFQRCPDVDGNSRSCTIFGLEPSSTYKVTVRACNQAGAGDWSTEAQGTTTRATRGRSVSHVPRRWLESDISDVIKEHVVRTGNSAESFYKQLVDELLPYVRDLKLVFNLWAMQGAGAKKSSETNSGPIGMNKVSRAVCPLKPFCSHTVDACRFF